MVLIGPSGKHGVLLEVVFVLQVEHQAVGVEVHSVLGLRHLQAEPRQNHDITTGRTEPLEPSPLVLKLRDEPGTSARTGNQEEKDSGSNISNKTNLKSVAGICFREKSVIFQWVQL